MDRIRGRKRKRRQARIGAPDAALTPNAGLTDLQVVKERLGHASISTTEKYLHSLPTADETALDALTRIRNPVMVKSA